jgi:hypothetical protein
MRCLGGPRCIIFILVGVAVTFSKCDLFKKFQRIRGILNFFVNLGEATRPPPFVPVSQHQRNALHPLPPTNFFPLGSLRLLSCLYSSTKFTSFFILPRLPWPKKWFTTTDLLLQLMKFPGCNVSAGK